MLIEFTVENFRSIKDEVTFSMLASTDKSHKNNLISTDILKKDKVLKSALISGPNASGKTNVIFALNNLRGTVINSHNFQKDDQIPYNPFLLDKQSRKKPTIYNITFISNGVKYIYGLSHTNIKIIDEYLYSFPNNRKVTIFERKKTNQYTFVKDKVLQNSIKDQTLKNVCYLSRATQLNYKKVFNAFDWFNKILQTIGPADQPEVLGFSISMLNDTSFKKEIIRAIQQADFGIDDIKTVKRTISLDDMPKEYTDMLKNVFKVNKDIIELEEPQMSHKGIFFDLNSESAGTQRLFTLIGPIIQALRNNHVLILDELDTQLHYLLNKYIINAFHDPKQNKKSQLIFTSHNLKLLDLNLFRRDQIWFTEKDSKTGETELYSLLEFKTRKDKDILRGYLSGRYGALPFIEDGRIVK